MKDRGSMTMIPEDVAELLRSEAARINSPEFITADPVQFPRRFSRLQDIEIVSLLAAIIAWGNRPMICRDAERLLGWMDNEPYAFLMEKGYEQFPEDQNIHRTFFGRHFRWLMRGLHAIYSRYGSLEAFSAACGAGMDEAPAWKLVDEMQQVICMVNDGDVCPQCLPVNLKGSALKRINMALRWLVRDDGIVDMGVWKSIPKSKLFIPLDVHVGNVSRQLGLLTRKSNDRKSVEELTGKLRMIDPDDPAIFDFALFGIGVNSKSSGQKTD